MNLKVAEKLQKYRKANGYSQEELAELLHVSRQSVSKWERGETSPDTDNLIALSKIYQVSIDELLSETQEVKRNKSIEVEDDKPQGEESASAKQKMVMGIVSGCTVMGSTLVYLLLGFCFQLWHPSWLVFMLLPLVASLADAINKKSAKHFAFPVLVVMVYLLVGFLTKLWHPLWCLFLLIPIYYIIVDAVEEYKTAKNK